MTENNSKNTTLARDYHRLQSQLCSLTFFPPRYSSDRILAAADRNLYYDPRNPTWCESPHWFGVVDLSPSQVAPERDRGYYIWQEGRRPTVAMEFLPPRTGDERPRSPGQPTAWEVYEQIVGIPFYVTFDQAGDNLKVFRLSGDRYERQDLKDGIFWFSRLEMGLGLWRGEYRGWRRSWLRWCDSRGNLIPTPEELEAGRTEPVTRGLTKGDRNSSLLIKRLKQLGIVPDRI